jgi:hydrogenase expression/formation protein HypE
VAASDLQRVLRSAGEAARAARVPIVSGDTKVVDRGAADGLFVTTTGVGVRLPDAAPSATRGQPGDVVVLSGPIGLHGTAILSAREGLGFDSDIASDTQPVHWLVRRMVEVGGTDVHTLRDPTRGGVASVLNELAEAADVGVVLDEAALPIPGNVRAACEVLGLDPLHVANEGVLLAFLAPDRADAVVPAGAGTTIVGSVVAEDPGRVTMRTLLGSRRIVDMLIGEQLPRIC